MILPARECLADVANAMDLTSAVEIGTHQGVFAKQFMRRFRGSLICVDPWESYDGILPTFYPSFDESTLSRDEDFSVAERSLLEFGSRVRLLRKSSEQAVAVIDSVDFVYIDGLHDYESVNFDVNSWYERVRVGGIISGHDYHYDHPGVIRSVVDLCEKHSLEFYLTQDQIPSWWAIKQ